MNYTKKDLLNIVNMIYPDHAEVPLPALIRDACADCYAETNIVITNEQKAKLITAYLDLKYVGFFEFEPNIEEKV
jgi:hypothetical protein